ncbi:MAG: hypothetical protein QXU81_08055 [Candidatus Bathyarchaeia archaeon]
MGIFGILQIVANMSLSALLTLTAIFPWISWREIFLWVAFWDLLVSFVGIAVLKESQLWTERKKG